jgi:4-hydroxy-2-oxoheptanedioate aldolase
VGDNGTLMADAQIPRLNAVIGAFEQGQPAFAMFSGLSTDEAIAVSAAPYDGVVIEMEHGLTDFRAMRDYMQYLLSRRQIVDGGTLSPAVTPIVRIPPNGGEMNQWCAKQALDGGAYGVVWPHISTVEEARNAVQACRYPRLESAERYNPPGLRGDGPTFAARYWGLTQQEYYSRADVWPLDPKGELLVILMIEDTKAIQNLPRMLKEVPGIGAILIGEGDLSQELGFPRQYEHPLVLEHLARVVATCKEHGVAVGHPHVTAQNAERVLNEGFTLLMPAPVRSYGGLEKGRQLSGRA